MSCYFLAGGVYNCNLGHWRSVAVLCMLSKIKSNPMHPLSSSLPLPCGPASVSRRALVAHRHSFAPPCCRIPQYRRIFVPSHCFCGTILMILCLMVWNWRVLRAELQCLLVGLICSFFFSPKMFSFSSFQWLVVYGWGLRTDRLFSLSHNLALLTHF